MEELLPPLLLRLALDTKIQFASGVMSRAEVVADHGLGDDELVEGLALSAVIAQYLQHIMLDTR